MDIVGFCYYHRADCFYLKVRRIPRNSILDTVEYRETNICAVLAVCLLFLTRQIKLCPPLDTDAPETASYHYGNKNNFTVNSLFENIISCCQVVYHWVGVESIYFAVTMRKVEECQSFSANHIIKQQYHQRSQPIEYDFMPTV